MSSFKTMCVNRSSSKLSSYKGNNIILKIFYCSDILRLDDSLQYTPEDINFVKNYREINSHQRNGSNLKLAARKFLNLKAHFNCCSKTPS